MISEATIGELSVLNCGAGDIRVSLDRHNPVDIARAERIITDMLKRGYLLFIDEGDGKLKRVQKFDAKRSEYIVAEGPLYPGETADAHEEETETAREKPKTSGKGKKGRERRVSIRKAKATGIAPTAGG